MVESLDAFVKRADPQQDVKRDALAFIAAAGGMGALAGGGLSALSNATRPHVNVAPIPDPTRWKAPVPVKIPLRPSTPANDLAIDDEEESAATSPEQNAGAAAMLKGAEEQTMFRQLANLVPDTLVNALPNPPSGSPQNYWSIPAAAGALGLGMYGANRATDAVYSATNEAAKTDDLTKAKDSYRRALINQYRVAMKSQKAASAEGASPEIVELAATLDDLFDAVEKAAGNEGVAAAPPPAAAAPPVQEEDPAKYLKMLGIVGRKPGFTSMIPGGGAGTPLESIADPAVGAYLATALGVGGLSGYGAYHWTKAQSPWKQLPPALATRAKETRSTNPLQLEIE